MKKVFTWVIIISGFLVSTPALAFYAPIVSPAWGNTWNNQWGGGFNNFNNFNNFGLGPVGIGFGGNNVGISVQTPYGGGVVSFPLRGRGNRCGNGNVYGCTSPIYNQGFGVQNNFLNNPYFGPQW